MVISVWVWSLQFFKNGNPSLQPGGEEFERPGYLPGRPGLAKRCYGITIWEMEDSVSFWSLTQVVIKSHCCFHFSHSLLKCLPDVPQFYESAIRHGLGFNPLLYFFQRPIASGLGGKVGYPDIWVKTDICCCSGP